MGCCGEQVNGQAGVSRLPEAFVSLTADFSMIVNSPTYLTVLTLSITTVWPTSNLYIMFSTTWRHTGPGGGQAACNFRGLVDAVLLPVGIRGATDNQVQGAIGSIAWQARVAVAAGAHTITLEVTKFGGIFNSVVIDPVTSPNLNNCSIFAQEQP